MHRITSAATAVAVVLATACAHDDGAGTTTVTSSAQVPAARDGDEPSLRLARELCAREAACNHVHEGARYRNDDACMSEQRSFASAQLQRWGCAPTRTQAGFEECLAAIRSERCETPLPRVDVLAVCRSAPVCSRSRR